MKKGNQENTNNVIISCMQSLSTVVEIIIRDFYGLYVLGWILLRFYAFY